MTRRNLIITLSVLFVCSICFFLIFHRGVPGIPSEKVITGDAGTSAPRSPFDPFTTEAEKDAAKQQPVSTWEEWQELRIKILSSNIAEVSETAEEFAEYYKVIERQQTSDAERFKAAQIAPPPYPVNPLPEDWEKVFKYERYYQGPQTPEALIAEFDEKFMEKKPKHVEWDAHYPKEAWLQRMLDKGVEFKEFNDYKTYLGSLRYQLIKRKDDPREWASGLRGITPTNDFAEFEDAFIDRKIWEYGISDTLASENPNDLTMVVFPPNYPDKYLPVAGNMTYVRLDYDAGGMGTWGNLLTKEQKDNLLYKGIEPKDIEIVYIDDDYNILQKPAEPYKRKKHIRETTYDDVPQGLRAPDGTIVSPERYREITGEEMPDETKQKYNEYIGTPSPAEAFARAEVEREAARTREVARAEFERFQNEMRQTEKFQSIAASEMSREFATQFLSQYAPKSGTDKRLQTALETMFQHGFEEGFRRLRKDDTGLAAELERQLAETHRPPKPQVRRQSPVPPKPSETPSASDTE